MSIADPITVLKMELQQNAVPQIIDLLSASLQDGRPLHGVEGGLWDLVLQVGRLSLGAFLDRHGTGDLGEAGTLPDGHEAHRLEGLHTRRYVSIFGAFTLQRTVYGSRQGQVLEFVPLDNRLQLPPSVFSYVLQDWDQSLAVEQAFSQVSQTIARILKLQQSVDSLEEMNRQMSQDVGWFRDIQGSPPAAEEGQIVVVTADCKGIVIRGQGTPTVCGGERATGQRANQKRMATVGADSILDEDRVNILDLLHVSPRLWEAAKLLYGEKGQEVVPFVRQRVTQILQGKVETVIRALRRLAAERGLSSAKKKALGRICRYFNKNRRRMRYDQYLRQGYPIASGVIEGACRHLIKDRLERAGMHWTLTGAQAMLDLRSVWIGGQWEAFQEHRIARETARLYPPRDLVAGETFFALAA